jgi:hypothetical protein
MDWEAFDETLARVDPRFSDPRFDSLKHVLTVLSSNNAEAEVEELREQRAAVEELVEGVVEEYHSGFNKAAHHYSQILRLFAESKLQARARAQQASVLLCKRAGPPAPLPLRPSSTCRWPRCCSWRLCAAPWIRLRGGCLRVPATWLRSTSGTRC